MPAENSTRIPTRSPAACTASASRWSTRCRAGSSSPSGATARNTSWNSPTASRWRRSRSSATSGGKRGTEVTFFPRPKTFTMVEFDFATIEHRLRELAFLNSGINIVLSDMRHAVEKREEMKYEGGVEEFVKYLDRNKTPLIPKPVMIKAEREGITVEAALVVERRLSRERAVLHQQHPAARRRHASRRLPRRAHPPGHAIRRDASAPRARKKWRSPATIAAKA